MKAELLQAAFCAEEGVRAFDCGFSELWDSAEAGPSQRSFPGPRGASILFPALLLLFQALSLWFVMFATTYQNSRYLEKYSEIFAAHFSQRQEQKSLGTFLGYLGQLDLWWSCVSVQLSHYSRRLDLGDILPGEFWTDWVVGEMILCVSILGHLG